MDKILVGEVKHSVAHCQNYNCCSCCDNCFTMTLEQVMDWLQCQCKCHGTLQAWQFSETIKYSGHNVSAHNILGRFTKTFFHVLINMTPLGELSGLVQCFFSQRQTYCDLWKCSKINLLLPLPYSTQHTSLHGVLFSFCLALCTLSWDWQSCLWDKIYQTGNYRALKEKGAKAKDSFKKVLSSYGNFTSTYLHNSP